MAISSANAGLHGRSQGEPVAVPGPVDEPSSPSWSPPAGACDCHAHLFGPVTAYPFAEGRGYTPPAAPRERYLALLDRLGLSRGVLVQGNAHGYDNRVILDAVAAHPDRLRGVAITDARVDAAILAEWHRLGMRGLRFHIHAPATTPGYKRGVGLDVFDLFRPMLRDLGWVAQFWCDWPMLPEVASLLAEVGRELPVLIDHMMVFPPKQGIDHPAFQALLRLLGEGRAIVKLSGQCRVSTGPDYPDVRPLHDALVAANPDGLVWGTDWPHTQISADNIPDDGHLVDLLAAWTPDPPILQKILVDTPRRLFWQT